jgi:hypothetical protein
MPGYIQIEGDPTEWWIAEQFPTSELTGGQPLNVTSLAPINGILVLSPKSATVAVFNAPSGTPPSPLPIPGAIIYLPTATGPSAGHVGYSLAGDVDPMSLSGQIAGAMHAGSSQTIALSDGGTLVVNGEVLTFAVLAPAGGPTPGPPRAGGPAPHG